MQYAIAMQTVLLIAQWEAISAVATVSPVRLDTSK